MLFNLRIEILQFDVHQLLKLVGGAKMKHFNL